MLTYFEGRAWAANRGTWMVSGSGTRGWLLYRRLAGVIDFLIVFRGRRTVGNLAYG